MARGVRAGRAVGGPPPLIDVDVETRVVLAVADEPAGVPEQRERIPFLFVHAVLLALGRVGRDGEVIDVRVRLEEFVEFLRALQREVVVDVVAGAPQFAHAADAEHVERVRFAVAVGRQLPLHELHVVEFPERGVAEDGTEPVEGERCQHRTLDADGVDDNGALMRPRDGRDGLQQIAVAAFEQRRQFTDRRGCPLLFGAERQQMREHADRGAAEAVAEDVEALDAAVVGRFAPVRELGFGIDLAEPLVAVLLRMRHTVVDLCAGDGRVDFTGAVPGRAEAAETQSMRFISFFGEGFREAPDGAAEIGQQVIDLLILAEAEHAGTERVSIFADSVVRHRHLPFIFFSVDRWFYFRPRSRSIYFRYLFLYFRRNRNACGDSPTTSIWSPW